MANKIVRLDNMAAQKVPSLVKSARYYKDGAKAPVENGTIVGVGVLEDGEREIHKVEDVKDTDMMVGIVCTPEVMYDERHMGDRDLANFKNEEGDAIRVEVFQVGDFFSIANGTVKEDMDLGAKLVAKHVQTEVVGRYTYECFEVSAK